MKKLIFFCLVGLFAVSCQPAEVTCDCSGTGGGSVTVSGGGLSLIDTNLTGHWRQTNVNNPNSSYFWDNGQIDLHFFENGTWHIDGSNGSSYNALPFDDGNYVIHSSNCIDLGFRVFNYTINNGVLSFTPVPGQDYLWLMYGNSNSASTTVLPEITSNNENCAEINNLTKQ